MPADATAYARSAEHAGSPNCFRMFAKAALGGERSGRGGSGNASGAAVAGEPVEGNCQGAKPPGGTRQARRGRHQEARSSPGSSLQQDAGAARLAGCIFSQKGGPKRMEEGRV